MGKKNHNKGKLITNTPKTNNPPPPLSDSCSTKFKKMWGKFWPFVVIVGVLLGIVANYIKIWPEEKSSSEKYEEANYENGILKAPVIGPQGVSPRELGRQFQNDTIPKPIDTVKGPKITGILVDGLIKTGNVTIRNGGSTVNASLYELQHHLRLVCPPGDHDEYCALEAYVEDGRLYISCQFKDLNTEKIIGDIKYNKWRVYMPNRYSTYSDDYNLEVIDNNGLVVISVSYSQPKNLISISGYFFNPDGIWVLNSADTAHLNGMMDNDAVFRIVLKSVPHFLKNAEKAIREIKPIHGIKPMYGLKAPR